MTVPIVMPKLGFVAEDGTLSKWLKHPGDGVAKGEIVAVIETDKVTYEVEAPVDGILSSILVEEGRRVPFGTVLAKVVQPGEKPPFEVPAASPQTVDLSAQEHAGPPPKLGSPSVEIEAGEIRASPRAKRLAEVRGIDLKRIRGSGPGGRILESDVRTASVRSDSTIEEIPQGRVRRIAAQRMTESFTTAPHFYLQVDIDATELVQAHDRYAATVRQTGIEPTLTDLLVYSVGRALRHHPRANAAYQDGRVVASQRVNVGIAVDTTEGLVVAIIPQADTIQLTDLCKLRADLVSRARAGRLRPEDVQGGTFTISNLGMLGIDVFHPIINPPQAAILAVGRLSERCVWEGDRVVCRPGMSLVLACDHRVLDGAAGARFLMDVLKYLPADL